MIAETECSGCGVTVAGGSDACQLLFDELIARDFSDATYFACHRLLVDTYCLQHPDKYCVSFKSLAAHLMGVCWSLEHGGSRAVPSASIRQWVERHPHLPKPKLPSSRGSITIATVTAAPDVLAHRDRVDEWARATWDAYAELHGHAREWTTLALKGRKT